MRRLATALLTLALWAAAPSWAKAQQPTTLTGTVSDEGGQLLSSATVAVQGLDVAALTNDLGRYLLIIPAARVTAGQEVVVTATMIGRASQTQTVRLQAGTVTVNFTLGADPLRLEEIVVTGMGQRMERQRLGVAISSVQAEELVRVPTPNLVNALSGKSPGIQVTSSSGDPGAASLILIRGMKTIEGSSQPLIVVDGVPVDNSESMIPNSVQYGTESYLASTPSPNRAIDINPSDIESIEVLKGPAAGAVYGARAANGVILITTKSGRPGLTRATLTSSLAVDQVTKQYPLQRRFAQGTAGVTDNVSLRSWGAPITGESFDHFGELFESGTQLNTDLALSGGSERTTYYLSLGLNDHNGIVTGDRDFFDKNSARLKATHRLTNELSIGGNFAYAESDGGFVQKGSNLSGLLLGGLRTPPNFNNMPYLTEDGFHRSYTIQEPTSLLDWGVFDNPLFTVFQNRNSSDVAHAYGNINSMYTPFPWLDLSYTLGVDYSNDERLELLTPGNYTYNPGYLGKADFINHQVNHTASATARQTVTEGVDGTFTLGYERNLRRYSRFFVEGQDFVVPYLEQLDNTTTRTPNEYRERVSSESVYGQAIVNIQDQLFLTGALRNDGFSTFAQSSRRHWFPKASVAWEFTRTLAMTEHPILSYGKLRAAWGQAGTEPPAYSTLPGYLADDLSEPWSPFLRLVYASRGALRTDLTKEQPNIGPERTSELELGADLSFLQDRIGLGITYYSAKTTDAILQNPLAPSSGYESQIANAATFKNSGIELTLDARALTTPSFSWSVGGNFSKNKNEVVSFGDSAVAFIFMGGFAGAGAYAVQGSSIGVYRGQDFVRCGNDFSHADSTAIRTACAGAPVGAYYVGANGFPLVDPTVRVIGDPNPDWSAGLNSTLTLGRNLRLFGLLEFQYGHQLWNGTRGALYSYGTHADTEIRGLRSTWGDFFQGGVPTVGPGATQEVEIGQNWFQAGNGSGFGPVATQFIEDASWIKLREISLDYTVPTDVAESLLMSGISVRVAGRNLFTWSDYTGLDPETSLTGTLGGIRGYDYFNNPQSRQWIFTLSLTR